MNVVKNKNTTIKECTFSSWMFCRPEGQSCTGLAPERAASGLDANKRVGDVVGSTEMIRQSRSRIQHRLEPTNQVDQKTGQHAVAVIQTCTALALS